MYIVEIIIDKALFVYIKPICKVFYNRTNIFSRPEKCALVCAYVCKQTIYINIEKCV
jgi:hypothetical protein